MSSRKIHKILKIEQKQDSPKEHRIVCSCGWVSSWHYLYRINQLFKQHRHPPTYQEMLK